MKLPVKLDTKIFDEFRTILEEQKSRETFKNILSKTHKKLRSSRRYFESIGDVSLFKNELEGELITVEGHLIHRFSVAQYNTIVDSQFSNATFNQILSDFPPHGLTDKNSRFNGEVLILSEDKGFTETFGDTLPFCLPISWYPFVRLTGFYSSAQRHRDKFSRLSIAFVEYRLPRNLNDVLSSIKFFIESELNDRNWLKYSEDFEAFAYLVPILFENANFKPEKTEAALSNILKQYKVTLGANMPNKLISFYDKLP